MGMTKSVAKVLAAMIATAAVPAVAQAAKCGNDAGGFSAWVESFKEEAAGRGISRSTLDKAFANVNYAKATIRADRGQKSFKLSLDQFMKKRGGQAIINRGKSLR